jgi:hypothetical protein
MLFWDSSGPILDHYQDHGQTVNSTQYCAILEEELKSAFSSKQRGMMLNEVVQHCDNAQPHTATAEMIWKLKF